jgi:hypothetical protein
MKLDTLTEILSKHAGARKDGSGFVLASDMEATFFVALEGETLQVARVSRVEVADTLVVVDTARGERYACALEDVRAVKIDRENDARGRERGAGFGKG